MMKAHAKSPPRVLVVDDDESVRATLEIILADVGIDVLTAPNVDRGLDLLAQHRVDLVITDMQMPEKSGGEMISAVRRKTPRIPVIAMSGNVRTAGDGADRVIEKPFDGDALGALVRDLLPAGR